MDHIDSIFLLFLVGVGWQVFTHFIRVLMLRFYFAYGYSFELSELHLIVSAERRREIGIGELGWSRRRKSPIQLSWIVDGVYHIICTLMPLIILGLYLEHFLLPASKLVIAFWIFTSLALLIFFNGFRYRKYKSSIKNYAF